MAKTKKKPPKREAAPKKTAKKGSKPKKAPRARPPHTPPATPPKFEVLPDEIPPMPKVENPGKRATLGIVVRRDEMQRIHTFARSRGMSTTSAIRAMLVELGLLETIPPQIDER